MKTKNSILFLIIWVIASGQLYAQYKVTENSTATIKGTSSLHDWESEVEKISGSAALSLTGNNVSDISQMTLSFVTKSIESGKGKMNSLTYEALKEEKYSIIEFNLSSIESIAGNKVTAKGTLSLAGVKKEITVSGLVTVNNSEVEIKSSVPIDMTQYEIVPPTALMGTIKVGKDVTVDFNIVFKL